MGDFERRVHHEKRLRGLDSVLGDGLGGAPGDNWGGLHDVSPCLP